MNEKKISIPTKMDTTGETEIHDRIEWEQEESQALVCWINFQDVEFGALLLARPMSRQPSARRKREA